MKQIYTIFCKAEEILVAGMILFVTALVFISAVARTFNAPINWAQDLALLFFAWIVMLGADVALRRSDFVRVGIIVERFPKKVQKFLYYFWYLVIIVFLAYLVRYGIPLAIESYRRMFQMLGISYSWATSSVPVGSALMILTIIVKLVGKWKEKEIVVSAKEAI